MFDGPDGQAADPKFEAEMWTWEHPKDYDLLLGPKVRAASGESLDWERSNWLSTQKLFPIDQFATHEDFEEAAYPTARRRTAPLWFRLDVGPLPVVHTKDGRTSERSMTEAELALYESTRPHDPILRGMALPTIQNVDRGPRAWNPREIALERRVKSALKDLRPQDRGILLDRYWSLMTFNEMAKKRGLSAWQSAQDRLQRAARNFSTRFRAGERLLDAEQAGLLLGRSARAVRRLGNAKGGAFSPFSTKPRMLWTESQVRGMAQLLRASRSQRRDVEEVA